MGKTDHAFLKEMGTETPKILSEHIECIVSCCLFTSQRPLSENQPAIGSDDL